MTGPRIQTNSVKTIGDLIEQLRHAVAHGHVHFDSDSRLLTDVTITFENRQARDRPAEWTGEIGADDLAEFCAAFSAFIEDYIT